MKKIDLAVMGAALTAASAGAMAYEAGDVLVRAGLANVNPSVKTDSGTDGLDVKGNTHLGLTAAYMVTPQVGVELLAATPFKHDLTADGSKIGSTKHLPPTVTVQWYPKVGGTVQPYLGAGLNYTTFWDAKLEDGTKLSLSHSTGLAVEAGVDVKLGDSLILNAAVWKIDIDTDVSIVGVGEVGKLQIDPLAAMVGVAFKF